MKKCMHCEHIHKVGERLNNFFKYISSHHIIALRKNYKK